MRDKDSTTFPYSLLKLLSLLVLLPFTVKADGEDGPSNSTSPAPPTTGGSINSEAGASGGSGTEYGLSKGGLTAIIVVVVLVVVAGSTLRNFSSLNGISNRTSRIYHPLLCG